jgi:diguanylate cyclase (GGDEF)-like protein
MRMRLSRLRWQVGLLARFALASLFAIILLGIVLGHELRGEIRQRALLNARQSAQLIDLSLVRPQLSAIDVSNGLRAERIARLDRALQASLADEQIARIKVWNRQARIVYASDHSIIGRRFPASDELRQALSGVTASEISDLQKKENTDDRGFGQLLEVYTPLRFGAASQPTGAFELYLPYRPLAATIARQTRRLDLYLGGGLALLYLVLFRIVAGASSRLRRQAAENEHIALHDSLTQLPNRSLFHDRAQQAILAAEREQRPVALMILDLDRFKEINDTLGHHNGDLLLQEIGTRIHSRLRASDTVARLGGDEFGVLLPKVRGSAEALQVADKLRQALHQPLSLQGVTLDVAASIGLVLYPEHVKDVATQLQRADVAMYLAKTDHAGCQLYTAERDEYSPSRLALAAELRRAIDRKELILHYQPKAALSDGKIVGVEALVRWQHPDRGQLFPDEFVPLAERTGLIGELTLTVLEQALTQLRAWQRSGLELNIAVNLSARDLLDLELPATIERMLKTNKVQANQLGLEITESVILSDPLRAHAVLKQLSAMGIQLAIDDYGSGYSSLGYLKRLPVNEIKIDRSFVMNMEQDENDAVIVRSTIELGRNLGLTVIAEGVENESVWTQLKALNCDLAQGYYLTRPIPASQLSTWLATNGQQTNPKEPDPETPPPQLVANPKHALA